MTIVYKVSKFDNKITEKQSTRQTAARIYYMTDSGTERYDARACSYDVYYDTWEEAAEAIRTRARKKLEDAERKVKDARNELQEVLKMYPEKQ